MTDQNAGATLVKGVQARTLHTAVAVSTAPMSGSTSGDSAEALSHLKTARVELRLGNIDTAIGKTRLVSGRSARLGDREVAGLLRQAAWVAPFGQIERADDLISQAEAALRAR